MKPQPSNPILVALALLALSTPCRVEATRRRVNPLATMRRLLLLSAFTTFYVTQLSTVFAQGTAFTYQGRLADGGNPAQGIYDLRFTIYDSATNGSVVAGPLTNAAAAFSNGLVTVGLDFGSDVFTGDARWLEIGVRTNGGSDFIALAPRQPLTPAPYAFYAPSANMANSASNLLGVLAGGLLSGTYSNVLNLSNPANSFGGDGSQLTAIGTSALADNSVTSAKIVDGTITSADISDGQIATVDLAASAVTTAKLADNSVTSAKIVDGTVGTADIVDSAISTVKLADNSVTSAKIVDGTITSADIGDGQVATVDLAASAVTTAKLADSSVTSAKIADGTITSADIGDGQVATADLAANAVTLAKLADGSVTTVKIVNRAVTSDNLANDSESLYWVTGGRAGVYSGKIGIGTPLPQATLDIRDAYGTNDNGTIHVGGFGANGDPKMVKFGDGSYVYIGESGADDQMLLGANAFVFTNTSGLGFVGIGRVASGNKLEVEGTASKAAAGDWLANSDARIKTDIATITNALDTLGRVRLVSFRYTDDYRAKHPSIEDRPYLNVVAQEFQQVFPDYVQSSGEPLDGQDILQVDSYPLTIYSAAAIQELQQQLKTKDAEIQALKMAVAELRELVMRPNKKSEGAQ